MDPVYGYQVTNVEASMASPSSLLHGTRGIIESGSRNPAFGLGDPNCPRRRCWRSP
ncbi:hypothetical protein SCALM49S_09347 [Streptomyces californicus]